MALDPQTEIHIRDLLDKHQERNDKAYAIKLVQTIVFYMIGACAIAVLAAIINLVVV